MKLFGKLLSLLVVLCIFGYVSSNAGDKKDKVAIMHNGHIIVVAPEAVPAHLAHGDVLVTNDITITINVNDLSLGSVDGPTSVPYGETATYVITPFGGYFDLFIDGQYVDTFNVTYTLTLLDVTDTHTIGVFFYTSVPG